MFYYARNIEEQTMFSDVQPWDFKLTETITPQMRKDKDSRQQWYHNVNTRHCFYTGLEGVNPNQRISKEANPPKFINDLAGDYDLKLTDERLNEVVEIMPYPPSRIERSLGGNARLVWSLPFQIRVDNYDFCVAVLKGFVKFLQLHLLPGLDENSFITPTRLLCNGCEWRETGKGPIDPVALQAFLVRTAADFTYVSSDPLVIPMDVVEKAIVEKFGQVWPAEFTPGTTGPSFWVEGSTSPKSAILKEQGMITFAAHADKMFYSWGDILGSEFVKQYADNSLAKATENWFYLGRNSFFYKNEFLNQYVSATAAELDSHLLVTCRLSGKQLKNGAPSPLTQAKEFIMKKNRIAGAAPFMFEPQGIIEFLGDKVLNIYHRKPIMPVPKGERAIWGAFGQFPFVSALMEGMIVMDDVRQLAHVKGWAKHFYEAAYYCIPKPGQNLFLMGGMGIGKTLFNREIIGTLVGGYADASKYLLGEDSFNSELVTTPHWVVDDPRVSDATKFNAALKLTAANQQIRYHKKFEAGQMTRWAGRIGVTTNTDFVSSRAIALDNSSMDKSMLIRCVVAMAMQFPDREEIKRILAKELPWFARYLLDMEWPKECERCPRYGIKAYHDPLLLDQTHQTGQSAPFKEVLIDGMASYFKEHPELTEWRGTVTDLIRILQRNPLNDIVLRSVNLSQANRLLEMIQREGALQLESMTGDFKTRLWAIKRFEITQTTRIVSGINFGPTI